MLPIVCSDAETRKHSEEKGHMIEVKSVIAVIEGTDFWCDASLDSIEKKSCHNAHLGLSTNQ